MTQKQKDLLLKDLCGRLPYRVKAQIPDEYGGYKSAIESIDIDGFVVDFESTQTEIEYIKPYLFPLSSMTGEQRIELYKVLGLGYESHYHLSKEWEDFNNSIDNNDLFIPAAWVSDINKMYNWLNKNHFDYHGLIHMGLAEDASGKNIY